MTSLVLFFKIGCDRTQQNSGQIIFVSKLYIPLGMCYPLIRCRNKNELSERSNKVSKDQRAEIE
jgi:hypothetical protein